MASYSDNPSPDRALPVPPVNSSMSLLVHVQPGQFHVNDLNDFVDRLEDKLCIYFQKNQFCKDCDVAEVFLVVHDVDGVWMNVTFSKPSGVQHALEVDTHVLPFDKQTSFPMTVMQWPPPQSNTAPSDSSLVSVTSEAEESFEIVQKMEIPKDENTGNSDGSPRGAENPSQAQTHRGTPPFQKGSSRNAASLTASTIFGEHAHSGQSSQYTAMHGSRAPPPHRPDDDYWDVDNGEDMYGKDEDATHQQPSKNRQPQQPQKGTNRGRGRGRPNMCQPRGHDTWNISTNVPVVDPGPSVSNARLFETRPPPINWATDNMPSASAHPAGRHQQQGQKSKKIPGHDEPRKYPGSAARKKRKEPEPSPNPSSEEEKNESDEEKEVVMAEVTGFKSSTSDATLKLYFENRRSGGGDIKTWDRDVKTGKVIRITFKNPSLIESVVRRTHKVEGVNLTVKQIIKKPPRPRPVKKRCLFLSGIPDGCSTEHLALFIENRSGMDEPTFQYGEMPGTAICTFSEEINDLDKAIDRICSKKIQDVYLKAERVHESDCILVQGFSSSTTLDVIELYFENKMRSGGGGVREVEEGPADGQAVVYFEDWKVVGDVLSTGKLHKLGGELLSVEEYHSNFGRLSPLDAPTPHIPKPISAQVSAEIMEFIFGKGKNTKVKLAKELKNVNAVLNWPDGKNKSSARLEPLQDQQRQSSWLKWPETSTRVLKDFLEHCKSIKVPIPSPLWKDVIDKVKQLDSKGYSIEEDPQHRRVVLVGEQGDVKKGSDDIAKIIQESKSKADHDAQQIKKGVSLQQLKLQLVTLCGVKDRMEKGFPALKITIFASASNTGLLLEGPRKGIQEAELFMQRELDNLEQVEIKTDMNKALFIQNRLDKIHEIFGSLNIFAACCVTQDDRITIYGAKKSDVTKARSYLDQEIKVPSIQVKGQAAISVLQNSDGRKLIDINKQKLAQVELTQAVTASVAMRTHKVDGAHLNVKQVIKKSRPVKKRCLFLSEIPDGCSTEHLALFIENRSGVDEPTFQYGGMPGTAICTFSEEIPDLDKAIDRICSKKIQDVYLTAERVHESDCILVQGFSSKTTLGMIEIYFENKMRSGSGGVREVKEGPADGQAVVYFEDWKVVGDVLSTGKLHKLGGKLLSVEEYHSKFGRLSPLDAPTPHIPKPISAQVSAEIMEFIFGKGKNTKVKLAKELKNVNAVLNWPDGNNKSSARLEPLLQDQQRQSSWLKWPETSTRVLKDFLEHCKSIKVPIPSPLWKDVIDKVKQLDSKGYSIEEDPQHRRVVLVGEQGDVKKGSDDIAKIIQESKSKADHDAQQIKKGVSLQQLKLQLVTLCGVKDRMEKGFPALKITIFASASNTGLLLEGPRKGIQEAELFMQRELDNLEQVEIKTDMNKALFIQNRLDKIHEIFGSLNIFAACCVTQDDRITIYGAKKSDVTKARSYLDQEIKVPSIQVKGQAAISVLQNSDGRKLIDINKQKLAQVELTQAVTASVAMRTHKVDGAHLTVKQVIKKSRPVKKRCLFLSEIPDGCSTEHLALFIENRSGVDEPTFQYGKMPGTAICTFSEEIPDLDKVIDRICSKKIQDVYLTAEKVHESDCILVQGFSSKTTLGMIQLYFENKMRSGSGGVREVKEGPADGQAVVYFEDWKVVGDVLSTGKLHKLGGELLSVEEYHSKFGHLSPLDAPTPHIPKPISAQVSAEIMEFIFGKGKNTKVKLEKELKNVNAVLNWPDGNNKSSARMEPLLQDQQRQSSWLKWPETSTRVLKEFLEHCKSIKIPIPSPLWKDVIDKVKQLDSKGYSIEEDPQHCRVVLLGEQGDVKKGSDDIAKIIQESKAKADHDAQQIKQEVPLPQLKHQLVTLCGVKDRMEKGFPALKITIFASASNRGLIFKGPRKYIQEAELFMRRELDNLEQVEIKTAMNKALFIQNVSDKIHEIFGSLNIFAACCVTQDGRITIYGAKKSDVTKARAYLDKEIEVTNIQVKGQAAISILQNSDGRKLIDNINKQKLAQVELTQAGVELAGFKTSLEEKKQKITEFLQDNVILRKLLPADKNTVTLINNFHGRDLADLMAQHTKNHVSIEPQMKGQKGFMIQGNQEGVDSTIQVITQLVGGVKEQQYPVSKTGRAQLFREDKGMKFLESMEKELECVIRESGLEESDNEEEEESRHGRSQAVATEVLCKIALPTGHTLRVIHGDLTKQTVDCIVNAANVDLKHVGGLSAAIVGAGGQGIQMDCDQILKRLGRQLHEAEPVLSTSGNLPCKKVIHVAGPKWLHWKEKLAATTDSDPTHEEQRLYQTILACLKLANKHKFHSIAIPAISTGVYGFPVHLAVQYVLKAVAEFCHIPTNTNVKQIDLTNIDQPTCNAFKQAVLDRFRQFQDDDMMTGTDVDVVDRQAYSSVQLISGGVLQTKIGSVCLQVTRGDLVKETTDAIVNSVGPNLNLLGPVSKAILASGGSAISHECDALRKKGYKKLVYFTGSGSLPCKNIVHVLTPTTAEEIKNVVTKTLQKAEEKKMKSISFPALGTGQRSTMSSVDVCAGAMLSAVGEFAVRKKPRQLHLIRFVIFQQDMFPGFQQALHMQVGTSYKEEEGLLSRGIAWLSAWSSDGRGTDDGGTKEDETAQETMILSICAMNMSTLQKATRKIDEFQEQEYASENMPDVHELIDKMSEKHRARLKTIEKKNHVRIQIDHKAPGKVMRVQGCVLDVKNARIEIQELFIQMQKEETDAQKRELLSKQVQWKYSSANGMDPYDPEVNAIIEEAFAKKLPSVRLDLEDGVVTLDFNNMQERSAYTTLVIQRVDLLKAATFKTPSNWVPMGNQEHFRMATLTLSTEYTDVQRQFHSTMAGSYTQINEIQRIQNKELLMQYEARKNAMESRLGRTNVEMTLYHGTDEQTCTQINKFGFNRSYCGKNASAFGNGTYFAAQASYSARSQYSKPDANGIKHIYATRVLVGDFTRGTHGMIAPPVKPNNLDQLYDSVVDNTNTPGIYVIFHDAQAYPEYLIKFQ